MISGQESGYPTESRNRTRTSAEEEQIIRVICVHPRPIGNLIGVELEQFRRRQWNIFRYPDPFDKPSPLYDQLAWLKAASSAAVDVFWPEAGQAIYGGQLASA